MHLQATRCATLLALLSVLTVPSVAAQSTPPNPPTPHLPVVIAPDVAVDRAVVTEAFATMPRLGLVIVDAAPVAEGEVVFVDNTSAGVRVRYLRPAHVEVVRTLVLPPGPSQAAEAVALVIINLVHDEAGDLLSLLAPLDGPETDSEEPDGDASEAASSEEVSAADRELPQEATTEGAEPDSAPASETPAPESDAAPLESEPEADAGAEHPEPLNACSERVSHGGIGVDLLPMVGTSSFRSPRQGVRGFSLNLAGGLSRGLHGLEIGGALNIQRSFVCGLQLAGALNVSLGPVRGVQIAGGFNLSLGPVRGLQIAPVNVTTGALNGVQLGVVNVAGDVRGLQLGLVNISRTAVAPIGLVSIVTRGRTEVHVTSSESGMIVVGASHGGRVIHNLYGFGARLGGQGTRFVLSAGLGARLFTRGRVSMDLDGIANLLVRGGGIKQSALFQLRLPVEVRIIPQVGVFAALSYQWLYSHDVDESPQVPDALVTTFSESTTGKRVLGWPGISVGMRVHL